MSLQTIAASFEAFAETEVAAFKKAESDTLETAAQAVEKIGETAVALVDSTGAAAMKLVADLWNDPALSGLEKANLAATTLVEQYAKDGITMADVDATYLIKSAYIAFAEKLRSLKLQ